MKKINFINNERTIFRCMEKYQVTSWYTLWDKVEIINVNGNNVGFIGYQGSLAWAHNFNNDIFIELKPGCEFEQRKETMLRIDELLAVVDLDDLDMWETYDYFHNYTYRVSITQGTFRKFAPIVKFSDGIITTPGVLEGDNLSVLLEYVRDYIGVIHAQALDNLENDNNYGLSFYACGFDGNAQNRMQEDAEIDGVELF